MSEHCPTPWHVCGAPDCTCRMVWESSGDYCVLVIHSAHWSNDYAIGDPWPNKELADANLEFTLRAVNSHDALVAACEKVLTESVTNKTLWWIRRALRMARASYLPNARATA